jgi:filamentous hemagglutinin
VSSLASTQTSTLPKRLGDAYLDQSLVSQAVINQTGQRFLSSSYTSDGQQMQALLDNAVVESSAEHLVVGQALSSTQLASLSSDIVWYVS